MKTVKSIFSRLGFGGDRPRWVVDPADLKAEASERRLVLFGSRCVVVPVKSGSGRSNGCSPSGENRGSTLIE